MSEIANQDLKDLKDLILGLDRKFDQRFAEMDKKNELRFAEMDKKMEVGFTEVKGEIKRVGTELKGEIKKVEGTLTEKATGIDKRLGNEELVSRGAFISIFVAGVTSFTKYFFFSDKAP